MVFKLSEESGSCQLFEKIKPSAVVVSCLGLVKNSYCLAKVGMIQVLFGINSRDSLLRREERNFGFRKLDRVFFSTVDVRRTRRVRGHL